MLVYNQSIPDGLKLMFERAVQTGRAGGRYVEGILKQYKISSLRNTDSHRVIICSKLPAGYRTPKKE